MERNTNSSNIQLTNESNPIATSVQVRLSMPDSFDIEMVEASRLREYEIWAFVASLMINFMVGFTVAAATNTVQERMILLWAISVIFFLFSLGSIIMMLKYRRKISQAKQTIKMVASTE